MIEKNRYYSYSERQRNNLRLVKFPAPPEEMSQLSEAIQRNNGDVLVYVHPFFVGSSRMAPPLSKPYMEQVTNSVNTALKDGKPLVVFEERKRTPTLVSRLNIHRDTAGSLYFIPTDERTPCPDNWREFEGANPGLSEAQLRRMAYMSVLHPLREAGATRAVLGGRYLDFQSPFVYRPREAALFEEFQWAAMGKPGAEEVASKGLLPVGCVGAAAQEFVRAGMDIAFSGISGPATTITSIGQF